MKTINANLPSDLPFINIYTFSDWHIGDKKCDIDSIIYQVNLVKNDEHGFVICNGDLCNCAIKNSVSFTYGYQSPQEELEKVAGLLSEIKDRILIYTEGNHEMRLMKEVGISAGSFICGRLGILDKFAPDGGVVFLRFGHNMARNSEGRKMSYVLYATHGDGTGGGRKVGSKANAVENMASIIDADAYFHAHSHEPIVFKQNFFRVVPCSNAVNEVERLFVNSSSQLNHGGYGERFGFSPSSRAFVTVRLNGTRREMKATIE